MTPNNITRFIEEAAFNVSRCKTIAFALNASQLSRVTLALTIPVQSKGTLKSNLYVWGQRVYFLLPCFLLACPDFSRTSINVEFNGFFFLDVTLFGRNCYILQWESFSSCKIVLHCIHNLLVPTLYRVLKYVQFYRINIGHDIIWNTFTHIGNEIDI